METSDRRRPAFTCTDERRVTEVNVAIDVLNRMRELERPSYVRSV